MHPGSGSRSSDATSETVEATKLAWRSSWHGDRLGWDVFLRTARLGYSGKWEGAVGGSRMRVRELLGRFVVEGALQEDVSRVNTSSEAVPG